jgi:hypothetical protein
MANLRTISIIIVNLQLIDGNSIFAVYSCLFRLVSDFFEFIFTALSIWPGLVRRTDNSAGFSAMTKPGCHDV